MDFWLQRQSPGENVVAIIHGGAWDIPKQLENEHLQGMKTAWEQMMESCQESCEVEEVIARTLTQLEECGAFDAGRGSFLNEFGEVELDAAIMRGRDLAAGAVAALTGIVTPSLAALGVLKEKKHVLLVGEGALKAAVRQGLQPLPSRDLVSKREWDSFQKWLEAGRPDAKTYFSGRPPAHAHCPHQLGTVGVVLGIRQANGRFTLAAGTSTGGTPGKAQGRVGDSPIIGAGVYCDDEGAAVSCTGWGEGFIRVVAAKAVSDYCSRGVHPQQAIESVLEQMRKRVDGRGGIIAVDALGRCGSAFTTPSMALAAIQPARKL